MAVSRTHKPEDLSLEEWQRTLRKEYGILQKLENPNGQKHKAVGIAFRPGADRDAAGKSD